MDTNETPGFNVDYWREEEFPITKNFIYLDNAAMSPLPSRVKNAIVDFHQSRSYSGASFVQWWDEVEIAREKISRLIGCHADEVAFTQNTSMGINLIAQGIPFQKGDNLIISDIEFPSNVYPWLNLESKGIEVRFVKSVNGTVPLADLENLIDERTRLISLSFVEAGNGFKNNVEEVSSLCQKSEIYFVVDAIQGLGVHEIDVKKLNIDFLVSGFFKWLFGPDGIGFMYCSERVLSEMVSPFVSWTSMEDKFNYSTYNFTLSPTSRRFEAGNLNFSGIRGVIKGLDLIEEIGIDVIHGRAMQLATHLREQSNRSPKVTCASNFSKDNQSQIVLLQCENDDMCFERLKQHNIIVNKRNGLRISPHFYNTKEELDTLLEIISE